MDISKITFPLYKLRSYLSIEKTLLGVVKVTTIKGTYILDDTSINLPFEQRRIRLYSEYDKKDIYKLKEQVIYLRQLVKYKSGTTFIDYNGNIIKYNKSSKLFNITSHKIINKRPHDNWTIVSLQGLEQPLIVGEGIPYNVTHASIMNTKYGPFLYDLTSKEHEPYRRKI